MLDIHLLLRFGLPALFLYMSEREEWNKTKWITGQAVCVCERVREVGFEA